MNALRVTVSHQYTPKFLGRVVAAFSLVWALGLVVTALLWFASLEDGGLNPYVGGIAAATLINGALFCLWRFRVQRRQEPTSTFLTITEGGLHFENGKRLMRANVLSGAVAPLDERRASVAVQTPHRRWLLTIPRHASHELASALGLGAHNHAAHFVMSRGGVGTVVLTLTFFVPALLVVGTLVWGLGCALAVSFFGDTVMQITALPFGYALAILVGALALLLHLNGGDEVRISPKSANVVPGAVYGTYEPLALSAFDEETWHRLRQGLGWPLPLSASGELAHAIAHLAAARDEGDKNDGEILDALLTANHSRAYRTTQPDLTPEALAFDASRSVAVRAVAARLIRDRDRKSRLAKRALSVLPLSRFRRHQILHATEATFAQIIERLRVWDPARLAM